MHDRLGAVEHPAIAFALGARGHAGQLVMRFGFAMRERGDARAGDDLGQLCALRLVAGRGDRAAGQHRAAKEGLDDQAAAQLLEDNGDVEAAAAETPMFLVEERADHAEVGELPPDLGAVAAVSTWRSCRGFRRRTAL